MNVEVTVVVSVFGVDGVAGAARAADGPVSSANLTLDGVDCFTCIRVSLSKLVRFSTLLMTSLVRCEIYWQSVENFLNLCSTVLWNDLRQNASVECLLSRFGY